jgi:hypothetical protein
MNFYVRDGVLEPSPDLKLLLLKDYLSCMSWKQLGDSYNGLLRGIAQEFLQETMHN